MSKKLKNRYLNDHFFIYKNRKSKFVFPRQKRLSMQTKIIADKILKLLKNQIWQKKFIKELILATN
ncbi:MAG: hypothetical protein EAZ97_04250 [Bacteroidetes bacterium]|nr:MAG: hypothetical protein EAZ97_04250 [Bacteroidota bacterium]